MHEDVAEAAREGLVLGGVECLVAEEDDAVIEEGAPDAATLASSSLVPRSTPWISAPREPVMGRTSMGIVAS